MAALVKGQNAPLTARRIRITVDTGAPAALSALLLAGTGKAVSHGLAYRDRPAVDGVGWRESGGQQSLEVDLAGLPGDVERVLAFASLEHQVFGAVSTPVAWLFDAEGGELGRFEMSGLGDERAVIAWEVYRRAGTWKVRAVGQGYAGGFSQLLSAYGMVLPVAPCEPDPAAAAGSASPWSASVPPATAPAMTIRPPSVALETQSGGPAVGPNDDERTYDILWMIFEDAARASAAYRSATEYADQRLDTETSQLLSDPRLRNAPDTALAREAAQRRRDELVSRATADFTRDTATLIRELKEISTSLPASMAAWNSPVWQTWRPVQRPATAIRLGELHIESAPELRIPMVLRLPMRTPLWIDSSEGRRNEATRLAQALVVRLLAAYPPGELKVHVADLAGAGAVAQMLQPLAGDSVHPAATNPQQLAELLNWLTERADLMRMAAQAGAHDIYRDTGRHLVVLHDFPYGFDDRAIAQLRFLIEEGPGIGVHLLFVADPGDSSTLGPLASSLWRSMLRLSGVPDEHIGDPWVGLSWTYSPDDAIDASIVDLVLGQLEQRRA